MTSLYYADEHRDRSEIENAVAAAFTADARDAYLRFRGMAARAERFGERTRKLEQSLEQESAAARQLAAENAKLKQELRLARGSLAAFRRETKALREDLVRVRTSRTMRVGRAVMAPARWLATLAHRGQEATGSTESRSTDSAPVSKTRNSQGVPPKPAAETPTAAVGPRVAAARAEAADTTVRALLRALDSEPSEATLLAALQRLFFTEGEVSRPAELVRHHSEIVASGSSTLQSLVRRVDSCASALTEGFDVPPRSFGAAYTVERRRVMYCVHQTPAFSSNSHAARTQGVAKGLAANGWDVTVVARAGYPWDSQHDGKKVRTERAVDGVSYVHHPGASLDEASLHQATDEATDAFVREARRLRPAIIHAASDVRTGIAALRAARRLGVPFVYEVRGLTESAEASTSHGCAGTEGHRLAVAMETLVAREADVVLAVTPQVADHLVAERGIDRARIRVVPDAVDVHKVMPLPKDAAYAEEQGIDLDVPVIGFAGPLVSSEGIDTLVDAAAILADRNVAFQVVVAGSGPELGSLQEKAALLGQRVRFLGEVPPEQMPRLVSTFDVMPYPRRSLTLTEFSAPLEPLDPFAAGKAVVLSDVAPHSDLADAGEPPAMLVRTGDATSLADALQRLAEDADLRAGLGRTARLWTLDERQWRHAARTAGYAYEDAMLSIAASADPGRPLSAVRVGVVAGDPTTKAIRESVQVIPLDHGRWQIQIEGLDAVLIEPAASGHGGGWQNHADLDELIGACRDRAIPTIFWDTGARARTAGLLATAAQCHVIFTVDADAIPTYRAAAGSKTASVASMPFFAQPKIHHPIASARADDTTVAYAGTDDGGTLEHDLPLKALLGAARSAGVTIYGAQPPSNIAAPEARSTVVRDRLSYAEVLETYKSHLAYIAISNDPNSPTAFPRRVVEIAASGGVALSSPSRGLHEALGDAAPVWDGDEPRAVVRLWHTNPEARRREQWLQMRTVLRSFTADDALAIMLRSAGLVVDLAGAEGYGVVLGRGDRSVAESILAQSVLPQTVFVGRDGSLDEDLRRRFAAAGVELRDPSELTDEAAPVWLGMLSEPVERTWFEDLLNGAAFPGSWDRVVPSRAVTRLALARPAGADDRRSDAGIVRREAVGDGRSLEAALRGGWDRGLVLEVASRARTDEGAADRRERLRVTEPARRLLVAGHDLKFLHQMFPLLERAGFIVDVDQWQSHTAHDADRSRELLARADVVLCEWGLGNAVWYSKALGRDRAMVTRVHSQELRRPHLANIRHGAGRRFVFVSEVVRRAAISGHGIPEDRSVVVPNYVDTSALDLAKRPGAEKRIGFVGMVPRSKRLDLALDVLEGVLESDPGYVLAIRGRSPQEYPWMSSRPEELRYFERQFARIEEINAMHPGAIRLEGFGPDMAHWYSTVGHVLSLSDFESFHLTIADGAASGATPHVLYWAGAEWIYPREWIHASVSQICAAIIAGASDRAATQAAVRAYGLDVVSDALADQLHQALAEVVHG